jgi:hypothetical protein
MPEKIIVYVNAISVKKTDIEKKYPYATLFSHRIPHRKKPWLSHFSTIDQLGTIRKFYSPNPDDPIIISIVTHYASNRKEQLTTEQIINCLRLV